MRVLHKKSRLGCRTCKRRKVKCDETTPECGNCIKFGVPCDYAASSSRSSTTSCTPPSTAEHPRRGRPRSDWKSWAEQISISGSAQTAHPAEPVTCRCDVPRLNVNDLELFYNYLSSTSQTVTDPDDLLWKQGVPQLGFEYPCVMHLMLALSALQLSREKPVQAARYETLAERHSTTALKAATALMKELSREHCPALYITATLICFTSLAQGPSERHMLLVADDGQVPWLSLIRGVRLIVSNMGWSSVFSGALADYYPKPEDPPKMATAESTPDMSPVKEDWRCSLEGVGSLSVILSQECREIYRREIESLTKSLEATFGAGKDAMQTSGTMQAIMAWIYGVENDFVERLAQRHPVALLILGHFCVLLRTLEDYWFVRGWARHIMREIMQEIDDSCHKWLAWPLTYLEQVHPEQVHPEQV